MTYKDTLSEIMTNLSKQKNVVFIGQQIVYRGNPMSTTLDDVPKDMMIEVPVMEESQMGMSLGMAMNDKFVITFYPRWDFLICATNQLVNHVDKIGLMSNGQWNANMNIRLGKGSDKPLDPGHQHKGNYLNEYKSLCKNIQFYDLTEWEYIEDIYKEAYNKGGIHVIVEYPELYYVN